jgi:TadE-like protein
MKQNIGGRFGKQLKQISACRSGMALIEFALILPTMVLIGLSGLELANLTMAHLRVNDIAIKVADNAARVRLSIDEADINEIMFGAKEMGKSINFAANGRIILSSIEPVMDSSSPPQVVNQYLRWQRCAGANAANSTHGSEGDGATGTAQADGYGVTGGAKIKAAQNTAIILAEVVYTYQPLVSTRWYGAQTIRAVQSIPVRQRIAQDLKNGSSLSTAAQARCSNPHVA